MIGGHIAGTGLYSGPLFVYLTAIPAFLTRGHPLGFGLTVAIFGVVNAVFVYYLAKKMFTAKVAVVSGLLYSGSLLMALFDRHYWNASLTPIITTLSVWFVWEIYQKRNWYFLPLAAVLALGFHAHGTGMAIIVGTILSLISLRISLRSRLFFLSCLLFLLLQLPLIIFDLRHDFLNTRALVSYLTTDKKTEFTLKERADNIFDEFPKTLGRLFYFPAQDVAVEQTLALPSEIEVRRALAPWWLIIGVVGLLVVTIRDIRRPEIKLLLSFVVATLFGLFFYKAKVPEYFFAPTFVPIFLLMGYGLTKVPHGWIMTVGLVVANFFVLINLKHSFGFRPKFAAVQKIANQNKDVPFAVKVNCDSRFCQATGFRYFFTYYGVEPTISDMDPNFLWLYERRISKQSPEKIITIDPTSL